MALSYCKHTIDYVKESNLDVDHIFSFKMGALSCFITYKHSFFSSNVLGGSIVVTHFKFYAESAGWDSFTESGFKSMYWQHDQHENFTEENVLDIFRYHLEDAKFKIPEQVQESLF